MPTPAPAPKGPSAAKDTLIYVVDDEAMIITLIEAILAPAGYRLELFRDPAALLQRLTDAKTKPHLLITDFAMGAINGLELVQRARALHPALKTLLISGTVDERFARLGAVQPDRFLAKPFQSRALLDAVASLLVA
jgi:CheY-like chemotaxis protein